VVHVVGERSGLVGTTWNRSHLHRVCEGECAIDEGATEAAAAPQTRTIPLSSEPEATDELIDEDGSFPQFEVTDGGAKRGGLHHIERTRRTMARRAGGGGGGDGLSYAAPHE
jgi:hypothetical protein